MRWEYLDKLTADYKATLARIEALKATCPREWTREGKVDIGLYLLVGVVAWFVFGWGLALSVGLVWLVVDFTTFANAWSWLTNPAWRKQRRREHEIREEDYRVSREYHRQYMEYLRQFRTVHGLPEEPSSAEGKR